MKRDHLMLFVQIQVRYINGTEGFVDTPVLEEKIVSGEISHFRRSDGWVKADKSDRKSVV